MVASPTAVSLSREALESDRVRCLERRPLREEDLELEEEGGSAASSTLFSLVLGKAGRVPPSESLRA